MINDIAGNMEESVKRIKITVKGIVQGVGFRPAMAKQAAFSGLTGKVFNTRDSVIIEIQGRPENLQQYIDSFNTFIPENAVISFFHSEEIAPEPDGKTFSISASSESGPTRFSIPPDIAMCNICRKEFYDPLNRRYHYPFITCGNCGPRYTYMKDVPYDRMNTSMSVFPFCTECLKEYNDPSNRRYHIEGFSCSACGPEVKGFDDAISALLEGKIAVIKGLGGYNIACSALDFNAVRILRERKRRPAKPFAVMFRSIEDAREYVNLTREDENLLTSKVSPIVIVEKMDDTHIAGNIAPENGYLGIMIPYTPLHQLILDSVNIPLVMTSANISGDPLIIDDNKAAAELKDVVDIFLTHNREIYRRADDSISFNFHGEEISIRMGRGKMPFPVKLPEKSLKKILAVGAELKSNISVVSEDNIVTSNHIGDLGTPDTFLHFLDTVNEMCNFYNILPDVVVADMHPDYESTSFAEDFSKSRNISILQVQHHYAHFLSCYFENRLKGDAAGIILDGTGFGNDGTIWGGEILVGDIHRFERKGRIYPFPLPGGDKAIYEPWRILSGLIKPEHFFESVPWVEQSILENVLQISLNRAFSPLTSSAGRLFDAAGALLGFNKNVSYEAEAAIYLEMLALKSNSEDVIPSSIDAENGLISLNTSILMEELYNRKINGGSKTDLAKIFHNSLIDGVAKIAEAVCIDQCIDQVVLGGGVFQNRIMLSGVQKKLASTGLKVFINRKIPANDAGISAGQAIYGAYNA